MTSYSKDPRVAFAENWWGEAAGPDLMARVASAPRDHLHDYRLAARSRQGFVPGSHASLKDVQLVRNNEGVLCDLRTGLSAALRRLGEVDPLDRASVEESMAFVADELSPLSSRLQGAAQKKVLRSVLQEELRPLVLRIPVAAGLGLATGNAWLAGAAVAIDTFAEMLPKHAHARDSTAKTASAVGRILSLE